MSDVQKDSAWGQFERRKEDHIRLALDDRTQTPHLGGLDRLTLRHDALPELDFDEISLETEVFGHKVASPLFISSMTAGHRGSLSINATLLEAASEKNWLMGVGSQRRELNDPEAKKEWRLLRNKFPQAKLLSNIGIAQVIESSTDQLKELCDNLEALALIVHTNPLQEVFQIEGTPRFSGGLKALERICRELDRPVILKETGCGFSRNTYEKLRLSGLAAVDVSGLGGTHWGRLEGFRQPEDTISYQAAQTFANWGIGTVDSLIEARKRDLPYQLWASGGVRSGLDAAKFIALGAQMVGFAQPIISAALEGPVELRRKMNLLDFELKVALFMTGSMTPNALCDESKWVINE